MSELPWYTSAPLLGPPLGPWPRRPSRIPLVLAVCGLVVALLVAGSGVALTVVRDAAVRRNAPDATVYLDGFDLKAREAALAGFLTRRAAAVKDRNKQAFLADLDPSQPGLVAEQTRQFDNLSKLPFGAFGYTLENPRYPLWHHEELVAKYHGFVVLPAVTTRYRIEGVDGGVDTAAPYVPILARVKGRWLLIGEAAYGDVDTGLPWGYDAQPWQGEQIAVRTSANAVLVYSPQDESRAAGWSQLLEDSIAEVRKTRPDKWSGKVYAVAVRDKKLYTAYQGGDGDDFAAFATERWDRIPEWALGAAIGHEQYAGALMVMNPNELDLSDSRLAPTFVHEITHVALAPVGSKFTPRWLVEGIARFVEYGAKTDLVLKPSAAKQYLSGKDLSVLPPTWSFYDDDGENYSLGWIACELIAKRYGTAKLLELYEAFGPATKEDAATSDQAFQSVLGISVADFTATWRTNIRAAIAAG